MDTSVCEREQARMKDCNKIFLQLRERLPILKTPGKRLSKIDSLRLTIKYIKHLKYLLSFPPDQQIPPQIVEFDPSSDAWDRVQHTERIVDQMGQGGWEQYQVQQQQF